MGIGSRCFLGLILGAVGGALGWLATDYVFNPISDPERMLGAGPVQNFLFGAVLGFFICLALGAADGVASASRLRMTRTMLRGAFSGLLSGGIGFNLGNIAFGHLGGSSSIRSVDFLTFLTQIAIRAFSWTIMGACLGGLYGLLDTGARKARNGAIGGAIGGFLGGLIFNPLAFALPNILPFITPADRVTRLIGWILLGAFLGFFTALVNILLKTAWVFVVYGRNEGREIILEQPISRIGRNELAEIPIFRDRLLAANHAEIRKQDNRYYLVDGGSAVGTALNGQKVVAPALLKDSDLIQVGNTQIVFYERATAGPVRRQVDLAHASPAAPPVAPEGHCQFCGQAKDPVTGACACTVGATLAASAAPGARDAGAPGVPYDNALVPGVAPATSVGSRLVGLSGPHAGEIFVLTGASAEIGRDAGNAVPLIRDTTVSRRHASLTAGPEGLILTDLGSSNGTFVNGSRISSSVVRPGDEIGFGTARFQLA